MQENINNIDFDKAWSSGHLSSETFCIKFEFKIKLSI